jgi:hypothetical protein
MSDHEPHPDLPDPFDDTERIERVFVEAAAAASERSVEM